MFRRYLGHVAKIFIAGKKFATKVFIADKKLQRTFSRQWGYRRCSAVFIKFGQSSAKEHSCPVLCCAVLCPSNRKNEKFGLETWFIRTGALIWEVESIDCNKADVGVFIFKRPFQKTLQQFWEIYFYQADVLVERWEFDCVILVCLSFHLQCWDPACLWKRLHFPVL